MSDEIGKIIEEPSQMRWQWRISGFMSLPEDVNTVYSSPMFFFSDACWCLKIYPNGRTKKKSEKWIGIYLSRLDSGLQKSLRIAVRIRKADGREEIVWDEDGRSLTFDIRKRHALGRDKVLRKSDLLSRRFELAPSGDLTLTCTLSSESENSTEGSLFSRLWSMSRSLKNILTARKRTDVVLNLRRGKIPAHKMILESRSAVFNSMFSVDMRESRTGEVNVEDADVDAFKVVLSYAYTGEPEGLSSENMLEVYKLAHKYDFQELRKFCADFMQECLSPDTVCDVIMIADLYGDKELRENANDYFAKNWSAICKSVNWKRFRQENPESGCDILETVLGGIV